MSRLADPALLAWLQSLAAWALHPALRARAWLPGRDLLLVTVLLLWAIGLVARALAARAGDRRPAWLVAAGAVVLLAGVGLDGIRGRHGTIRLAAGQTVGNFEETAADGRPLGLRPLGFGIGVERLSADGVALVVPGRGTKVELRGGEAVAIGPFRVADPSTTPTGGASRLRVAASDGKRTQTAELAPGQPGRLGDLVVSLEQYFPDFALDQQQQPFSRSLETRNPAALLSVEREGRSYRAFVIQSLPGVHRVEPLGLAFSLLDVEPELAVTLHVHREPFALAVVLGLVALVAGAGLQCARALRREPPPGSGQEPLLGGAGLVACLLLLDGGRVLAWSFSLSSVAGPIVIAGAGVLLGISLLAALAGTLLLAAQALSGGADVTRSARAALWLAIFTGAAGVALSAHRLSQATGSSLAPARPLVGIALALVVCALALRTKRLPPSGRSPLELVWPAAGASTLLAALGLGVLSLTSAGTYATSATSAVAASALFGLAAGEATKLAGARRLAFLVALLLLFVRPS